MSARVKIRPIARLKRIMVTVVTVTDVTVLDIAIPF
jgi:hypothetical protein